MCTGCGAMLGQAGAAAGGKNKVTAGILGILLGALGVHKFYLGCTSAGVIMLLVTILGGIFTLGLAAYAISIIALVEGIIYLCKGDEEFDRIYVQGEKPWF